MKTILRYIVFYTFALYLVSQLFPSGLIIHGGLATLFLAGVVFAALNLIVKPIIKAIALPFLFFTLGLFSFAIDAGILFVLTKIIPAIQIHAFTIPKFAYKGVNLHQTHIAIIFAYLLLSAIIAFISIFLRWISE